MSFSETVASRSRSTRSLCSRSWRSSSWSPCNSASNLKMNERPQMIVPSTHPTNFSAPNRLECKRNHIELVESELLDSRKLERSKKTTYEWSENWGCCQVIKVKKTNTICSYLRCFFSRRALRLVCSSCNRRVSLSSAAWRCDFLFHWATTWRCSSTSS